MAEYTKPVVFTLGNESYGIDINLVSSIENQVNVVPVPNSLQYIKGIINLRGVVIPVFNLKKKFNMDNTLSKSNSIVVVKLSDITIAFEVDAVEEIKDIAPDKIVDMPRIVKTDDIKYFDRVASVDGKLIVLLDIEYLLSNEERETAKNIIDNMK